MAILIKGKQEPSSQVKGIPDVARHAPVTVTECSDTDNFPYPEVFPQHDTDEVMTDPNINDDSFPARV